MTLGARRGEAMVLCAGWRQATTLGARRQQALKLGAGWRQATVLSGG